MANAFQPHRRTIVERRRRMIRSTAALLTAVMLAGCCGHIRPYPADWTSISHADRLKKVPDHVLAAAVRKYPGYGFKSAGATMCVCRGVRLYHLHAVSPEDEFVIMFFDPDGNFVEMRSAERPNDGT